MASVSQRPASGFACSATGVDAVGASEAFRRSYLWPLWVLVYARTMSRATTASIA